MQDFEHEDMFSEYESKDEPERNAPQTEPFVQREPVSNPEPVVSREPESRNYVPPVYSDPKPYSYRGNGTGRKESPYANSPYRMNPDAGNSYYHQPRSQAQTGGRYQPQYEAPKAPPEAKKKSGFWKKALAVVAALALVVGSCGVTAMLVNNYWEERTDMIEDRFTTQIQSLQQQIDAQSPAATGNSVSGTMYTIDVYTAGQVYAQNVQSVVLIECMVTTSMYGQTATGTSAGSGFILTEDGYVVTNYHVVEGASSIDVILHDGVRHSATVVGYDDTNDVAVVKVEASGLKAVSLGSSDDLIVGDQVVAIGNPLGELTSTLTVGYVSAKERDISTDGTVINMIQTDAAINSGNSGGPLFNMKGEVVGITTAKYSGSSSSGASIEGIGFAIPIDDVLEGIGELMEYGHIKSAYLGVEVRNMDASTAEIYGLPVGAYVAGVMEGGAAQRAGIQVKDIIIEVGSTPITSLTDLTRALRDYEPGDVAAVKVYRGGMELTLQVALDERPQETGTSQPEVESIPQVPEGSYEDWFNFFAPFFGYGNGG